MLGRIFMRFAIYGAGAAVLLTAAALPANAASTEGSTTTTYDQCVTLEELGLTFCRSGTERRIEVHTPAGVVVLQRAGDVSDSTTYPGGTITSESTYNNVSVFASSVEGPDGLIYFDPNVIRIDSAGTLTYPDMTCTFDVNYVAANDTGGYNHNSGTCTAL